MAIMPEIDSGDQTKRDPRNSSSSPRVNEFEALSFAAWEARSTDWEFGRGQLGTAIALAKMATAEASRPLVDETVEGSATIRLANAARVVTAITINGSDPAKQEGLQMYIDDFIGAPGVTLGAVDEMIQTGSITQEWLDDRVGKLDEASTFSSLQLIPRNGKLDDATRQAKQDTIPGLRVLGARGQKQFDVFERIEGQEIIEWPHLQISGKEIGPYAAAATLQIALLAHTVGSNLAEVAASRPLHTADVVDITQAPSAATRAAIG